MDAGGGAGGAGCACLLTCPLVAGGRAFEDSGPARVGSGPLVVCSVALLLCSCRIACKYGSISRF